MSPLEYLTRFEEDGIRFFELLGGITDNREQKTLYGLLRNSEERRLADLRLVRNVWPDGCTESPLTDRMESIMNRFRLTMMSTDIRKALKHDQDAYEHVLLAEEEIIRLFEGMSRAESREDARSALAQLAESEKGHLTRMEEIYRFVEDPRCYLEWGEFSNLRQL